MDFIMIKVRPGIVLRFWLPAYLSWPSPPILPTLPVAKPTPSPTSAWVQGGPAGLSAWRYIGSNGDNWYIEDVRVFEALDVDVRALTMAPAEE